MHTIWLQCKARPAAPGRCQSTAPAPGRSVSYYRSPQPGRAAGALPRRSGRALTPARAAPGRLNEATRGRRLPPTRPASRQPTARWIGVSRAGPAGRPPPTRRVVLLGVGHELARMRQRAGVVRPGHLPNIVTIIHCHLSAPAPPPPSDPHASPKRHGRHRTEVRRSAHLSGRPARTGH